MATKAFYFLGSLASGSGFLAMQEDGTAPTAAELSPITRLSPASGSAIAATGEMADYWAQVGRAPAVFSATAAPLVPDNTNGNGGRIPTALTGTFAAGNWPISVSAIARTNNWNGRHRFRLRVFRSTSATGASPTEITTSTVITDTTSANVTQNATDTRTATWSAPGFSLTSEYLFFTLAMEVTTAGTTVSGGRDVNLYGGSGLSITTTDFTVVTMTQHAGMIPI